MSHELFRLREKLVNTPLLVDKQTYESVLSYIESRNAGDVEIQSPRAQRGDDDDREYRRFLYNPDTQTAVMYLEGPTSYRPITFWGMDCGGFSYTNFKEDVELAIADGAKTIALMVDSGGGEGHGLMDSARYVRKLLEDNGVYMVAYVDGRACSAAYAVSCISDEIIASTDSELGSIGVLVQLMNNSESLKMRGIERTFITAGSDKVPFENDGSWREGFLEDLQNKVDVMYSNFTEHVAQMRNIPVEAVRATQANTYLAKDAVALGLADKVMTPEEFYTYLADKAQINMESNPVDIPRIFKFSRNEEDDPMKLAELQTQLETAKAELEALQVTAQASIEQVATLEASVAEMVAQNEELAQALASAEDAKAALETELSQFKLETVTSARKARLSAFLPEAKVDTVLEKLAALDDEAFEVAAEGYELAYKATEQSDLMQEQGQDGEEQSVDAQASGDEATRAAIARMMKR